MSTGNLNESTARVYADHCLLTSNRQIMADINRVFDCLEKPVPSLLALKSCKVLIPAPVNMRKYFGTLIQKQVALARKKKPASLVIKLNSLSDEILIEEPSCSGQGGC